VKLEKTFGMFVGTLLRTLGVSERFQLNSTVLKVFRFRTATNECVSGLSGRPRVYITVSGTVHEVDAAISKALSATAAALVSFMETFPMIMKVMRSGRWISVYMNSFLDDLLSASL